jgi:hypothetical protein
MSLSREVWVKEQVALGADKLVINFIGDIKFYKAPGVTLEASVPVIDSVFNDGYDYYFAMILEKAFPGGKICVMYPFLQVCYVYENVAYTIDGIAKSLSDYLAGNKKECLIPIEVLGEEVFVHIPGEEAKICKDDINTAVENYLIDNKPVVALVLPSSEESKSYIELKEANYL